MRKDNETLLPLGAETESERPRRKATGLLWQAGGLVLTVFVSQFLLQWFQNDLNLDLVLHFIFSWHTEKFLLSMLVLMVPLLWLWALMGRPRRANLLFLVGTVLIGLITFEKMRQRNEPLYPSDFRMVTELGFLLEMVPPGFLAILIILALAAAAGIYWQVHHRKRDGSYRLQAGVRIVLFLFTSMGLVYLSRFQEPGNLLKKAYDRTAYWIPYSQEMNYYNVGFVGGFLYNFSSSPMVPPDGFSPEGLAAIMEEYEGKAAAINAERNQPRVEANVIYVMNESFADPLELSGLSLKEDPIPFTRRLMGEQRGGEMLSQGYGGGTANIEFEALTGFSMEPFAPNISTPYTQFLPREQAFPSVVSRLKEEGHHALAIHPFDTSMYKRRDNYQVLGFDAFYYDETMRFTQRQGNNPFISDRAAYREILHRMGETEGYDFVHLVTMQNHTPYEGKYPAAPGYGKTGVVSDTINQYLQDLRYADQALGELYREVQQMDEPTVVVFWGDHWPNVFGDRVQRMSGKHELHETPVVLFSNRPAEPEALGTISPIYFFNEVLRLLDAKVTPFEALLLDVQAAIPAFEKGMYRDPETGEYRVSREELPEDVQRMLEVYDWIQYDVTSGDKTSLSSGFFRLEK